MSAANVPVNAALGSDTHIQTFLNTIGGSDVHAQAITLVDTAGASIPTLPVSIAGSVNVNATPVADVKSSNASNFLAQVSGTVTATISPNSSFNLSQVLGTTVDVNSGGKSAGTQRVILASDQTNVPITVQGTVTLAANSSFNETQVLGTTIDVNSGNKSAGTQRVILATDQPNVPVTVQGSASITANSSFNLSQVGGTVVANQTAGTLDVAVARIGSAAVTSASSGIQKVGISGSTGAAMDAGATGGATAPANGLSIIAKSVLTAPTLISDGLVAGLAADGISNLRTVPAIGIPWGVQVWNSGTALNTFATLTGTNAGTGGSPTAPGLSGATQTLVHIVQSAGTFSAGAITFEVSYDDSNWVTMPADAIVDPNSTSLAQITIPYTLTTSTNKPFLLINRGGWRGTRIKLSTAITGTGTVTINSVTLPSTTYVHNDQDAIAGTAIDVNSGSKSAGTQRVVIATDQPALTNKLLVTPDANSSFNLSQVLGSTVVSSVTGVQDTMPRLRDGSTGLSPQWFISRISTQLNSFPTNATAYIESVKIMVGAGTAAALTIRDQSGSGNRTLLSIPNIANVSSNGVLESYIGTFKMTGGININTTGGASPSDVNVFMKYWQ